MFQFLCVTPEERSRILRHGLDLTDPVLDRLKDTLDETESSCQTEILVAQKTLVDRARARGAAASTRLPKEVFLNIDPYHRPLRVHAGGGYVVRQGEHEPEVLLIFRRGRWDLPKGKRDGGETIEACAVREVREEIGIRQLEVVAPLGTTLHGYPEHANFHVKTTFWFLMHTSEIHYTPQRQEGIEQVVWVPYSEAIRWIGFETLRNHMVAVRGKVFERLGA